MSKIVFSVTPWPEDSMKKYQWLDVYLQNQPSTRKEFNPSWQAYRYLLCNKMYAYIGVDDRNGRPVITLKLEPMFSDMLRREFEDVVPGYYMNKLHWSTIYLDGEVPQDALTDMISASYKLVRSSLSQKLQRELRPDHGVFSPQSLK